MVKLTKEQRRALKHVFDRAPVLSQLSAGQVAAGVRPVPISYRQFRKRVVKPIGIDCIMIPWQGMFLGIELDGHVHS